MPRTVFSESEYAGFFWLVEQSTNPAQPREGLFVFADNSNPSVLKYIDDLGNIKTISTITDHGDLTGLTDVADHPGYVTLDGLRPMTGDWDIGDGRMFQADKIRARDGDGLSLFEDGGLGIYIRDGGHVEIAGAILADGTRQALIVAGTLPTSPSTLVTGVLFDVTSAGSATQAQYGLRVNLNAGFTGNHLTAAMGAANAASGVGANLVKSGTPFGNAGFVFTATGVTAGYNYGATGFARDGNVSIGGFFRAGHTTLSNDKNGATYIGVGGIARNNTASGSKSIGGYFGLNTGDPTFESAALIADNADAAYPIFLGRDNGSIVFSVVDGGRAGVGAGASPTGQFESAQKSTTAAIPALVLEQADLSEEFIRLNTTVGSGNPVQTSALGTYYGMMRVTVNGIVKWIPLYNTPT